jgi:hypothetical protein
LAVNPNGLPVSARPSALPNRASGIDTMITSGCRTVRNCRTRMRKIASKLTESATAIGPCTSPWFSTSPPYARR